MDHQNISMVLGHPHRRSPSADHRFSSAILSPSNPAAATALTDDHELNEADVFYNTNSSADPTPKHRMRRHHNPGILAALSEAAPPQLFSPSRNVPTIPMPMLMPHSPDLKKCSQSVPAKGFEKSNPVRVPTDARKESAVADDDDDDCAFLPPHEIVARSLRRQRGTVSFSVLEGAGRTLKGRDLRQVRDAVWKKTGFLDP